MLCFQCEQTSRGTGCTLLSACGKDAATAALQDLLIHAVKGVASYAHRARTLGEKDREIDAFVLEAVFATLTNVNFDPEALRDLLVQAARMRDRARSLYEVAARKVGVAAEKLNGPTTWQPAGDVEGLVAQGNAVGLPGRREALGEDLFSLQELYTYGIKGVAAYAYHARQLGVEDDAVYGELIEALDYLTRPNPTVDEMVARNLKLGGLNLRVMEMLDRANTSAYGDPTPTPARVTPVDGKAILVSGHELKDLAQLLEQTAGKGINVYTHGEMLPAHGYPKLKAYPHLVGNYGGAWQDQGREFDEFPGAILMTTNCIQRPRDSYMGRIFTSGPVAWPGVQHISDGDFTPVVEAALAAPGFAATEPEATVLVGFGHAAVLSVADKVVEAVKAGQIRHFFLIGGCDGAKPGRNYYTELAQAVPQDSMILTLACGKYRFNKLEFGTVAGLPRLLDVGQCNDAYSAIRIAVALAEAFGVGVNDLPLSIVLSWYEQKAVAILLTLLHLGIKNIRIGPSLPAFVSPTVLSVLVESFVLAPITTPEADLQAILG